MTWKKRTAALWVEKGHEWGLKVHVGRTPRVADLLWAERIGADSVDSTTWSRNGTFDRLLGAAAQRRIMKEAVAVD